jgi:copper homeostasis protein CutC
VPDVFCGEFTREPVVQFPERREGIEHISVTRRVRATACDHIRAVRSVFADGVGEHLGMVKRVVERPAQVTRLIGTQDVRITEEMDEYLVTIAFDIAIARLFCVRYDLIGMLSTGEFLDQPQCGLLYPPTEGLQTTLHPILNTA